MGVFTAARGYHLEKRDARGAELLGLHGNDSKLLVTSRGLRVLCKGRIAYSKGEKMGVLSMRGGALVSDLRREWMVS